MSAIEAFLFSVLPELTALKWNAREIAADLASRKFIEGARPYRERFRTDGIGVFDAHALRSILGPARSVKPTNGQPGMSSSTSGPTCSRGASS